jgi:hypothetical protein
MRYASIAAALVMLASSARAAEPVIQSGLDYIRSEGATGAAMSDYIKEDPVPMGFGTLPQGVAGQYQSEKRTSSDGKVEDRSRIVLDEKMRSAPTKDVGHVLFHEYVHRLEDTGGGKLSHRPEDFDVAMDTLQKKTRPSSGRLEAPEDIVREFDKDEAPALPKEKRFALRGFQSFQTGAGPSCRRGLVYSAASTRQTGGSAGVQVPATRTYAASGTLKTRASTRNVGASRPAQVRSWAGRSGGAGGVRY